MAKKKEENQELNLVVAQPVQENVPPAEELENLEQSLDLVRLELSQAQRDLNELRKQKMALAEQRREVTEEEKSISERQFTHSNKQASLKEKIERQKAYDNVLVTGRFIHRKKPGSSVKLTYIKYADDAPKWWPFQDGQTYTIPRGFADQINEYYHTPQFIQKPEGSYGLSEENSGENSAIAMVNRDDKKYIFAITSIAA